MALRVGARAVAGGSAAARVARLALVAFLISFEVANLFSLRLMFLGTPIRPKSKFSSDPKKCRN